MLRQQSLWEAVRGVNNGRPPCTDAVQVTDLFCGAGGFSCGAKMAGCTVVFACDSDKFVLETHSLNHPETRHVCGLLPDVEVAAPAPGARTHLHGSPPCQMFSTARAESTDVRNSHPEHRTAESLVEWYLRFALNSQFNTWTMEQVPASGVIQIVERVRREHPSLLAYTVIDMAHFGVPQHRKRLIAGSPSIVAWLKRAQSPTNIRSVQDVICKPRGTHIRNSKSWCKRTASGGYQKAALCANARPICKPAYTVVTNGDMRWGTPADKHAKWHRLTVREKAMLQTFPSNYRLPMGRVRACRQIGNAVPPLLAKVIMNATRSLQIRPTSPSLRRPPGGIEV